MDALELRLENEEGGGRGEEERSMAGKRKERKERIG